MTDYSYFEQLKEKLEKDYLLDDTQAAEFAYLICEKVTVVCDPPPIPDRSMDFQWTHEDYDGVEDGNGWCGAASNHINALIEAFEVVYYG